MPRKSLAASLAKDVAGKDGWYIVVYDFPEHIPTRFYKNLEGLIEAGSTIVRVQKSVYIVEGSRAARALSRLVEHYGGYARIFKICEEEPTRSP